MCNFCKKLGKLLQKCCCCCCGSDSSSENKKKKKSNQSSNKSAAICIKCKKIINLSAASSSTQPFNVCSDCWSKQNKSKVTKHTPARKKKIIHDKEYMQLEDEGSESEEHVEPEEKTDKKVKTTTKFAPKDVSGNFYVGQHRYKLTDNQGTPGHCLWNILRNHGIPEKLLTLAANESNISVDSYVDTNQLSHLFAKINNHLISANLDTIGYRLDVVNYENGNIIYEGLTCSAYIVLSIGLLVNNAGIGHYVEDRNSVTLHREIQKNFYGDEKAKKKCKEEEKKERKKETKLKEKEENEKRQAEFEKREKIKKEHEQAKKERKDKIYQRYLKLEKQKGDTLRKNIQKYCSASTKTARIILQKEGFIYPAATAIASCVNKIVWMYLMFMAYNWNIEEIKKDGIIKSDMKAGNFFENKDKQLRKLIPGEEEGIEYDTIVPEIYGFRAFFRFIKFDDETVYFTRDHYLTFINIKTGKIMKSQEYQEEEKKKQ